MNKEQIEKAKMTNEQLGPEEIKRIEEDLSDFKRYLEILNMIPGASQEEADNKATFIKHYGLKRDYSEDAVWLMDVQKAESLKAMNSDEAMEVLTETAFRYIQFLNNKLYYRDRLFDTFCVPKNEQMKKWRSRQIERSKGAFGSGYGQVVHMSVAFELTDGCSVGCEFCAIGAKKLKKIFKYTEENARLFDSILNELIEVIGHSSCRGTLYYGSEPLDNPDYEKFAEAVYKKAGLWPQITTAIPLRDRARMHRLIKELETKPMTIYRFSVKSVEEAEEIFREFTPRELLRVELLPQYKEAPSFTGFANAGRARENGLADGNNKVDSICCISGFVINLGDKTVRLVTPVYSDDRFPTGEVIYERTGFDTAEDLKKTVTRMIETYMHNELPKEEKLGLCKCFKLVEDPNVGTVLASQGYSMNLTAQAGTSPLHLLKKLAEGEYTAGQLADILAKEDGMDPVDTYWLLHALWGKGVIDEFNKIAG